MVGSGLGDIVSISQAMVEAMRMNTSVKKMDLRMNDIGAEGAKAWPVMAKPIWFGTLPSPVPSCQALFK